MLEIILVAAARPACTPRRGVSRSIGARLLSPSEYERWSNLKQVFGHSPPPIADSLSGDVAGHEVC